MSKKGLSDVVTTVLIILIAIAAVAVVGGIVLNQINKAGDSVELKQVCIDNKVIPVSCKQNGASAVVGYQYASSSNDVSALTSLSVSVESTKGSITSVSPATTGFSSGSAASTTVTQVVGPAKHARVSAVFRSGNKDATCVSEPVNCEALMPTDYFGYWSFDELAAGALAPNAPVKDYSLNNWGGRVIGNTLASSPLSTGFGNALQFGATGSYVNVPTFSWPRIAAGTPISVSFWAFFDNDNSHKAFFSLGTSTSNPRMESMVWNNGALDSLIFDYGSNGGVPGRSSSSFLSYASSWKHILLVSSGVSNGANGMRIYVNGQPLGNPGTSNNIQAALIGLNIGKVNVGITNTFNNGKLDEFIIYNRVLSASEVNQIYEAQRSKFV